MILKPLLLEMARGGIGERKLTTNKMKIIKGNPEYSVSVSPWWFLASLNEFLQVSRIENKDYADSMNISIILNSATVIEGLINETLNMSINSLPGNESLIGRLEQELKLRIEKSSWGDLQNLYRIVKNKELSKDISSDVWKRTQSLFDFRNMIVHGKELRISTYTENNIRRTKVHGKYLKIYDYLQKEMKVIEETSLSDGKYPTITLITNESSDFYWETARAFIKDFHESNKDGTIGIISRLNEFLKIKIE